jgi:hypothetical protein
MTDSGWFKQRSSGIPPGKKRTKDRTREMKVIDYTWTEKGLQKGLGRMAVGN